MSQMCRMCIRGATAQNVNANNFYSPSMYALSFEIGQEEGGFYSRRSNTDKRTVIKIQIFFCFLTTHHNIDS